MRCVLIAFVLFWNIANGQTDRVRNLTAEGLQVGERLPDLKIGNVYNYSQDTLHISDFSGKLLILDFWATWCAPCISMLPKTDDLQKLFEKKIQLLPVTYQSAKEVIPFLERLYENSNKEITLPFVIGQKKLHKLFPHQLLPHYVWIDPDGIVLGITGYEEINEQKITQVLSLLGI